MIITNNAVFLLLPKTGGTWLTHVLKSISIDRGSLDDHAHKPRFVFVRNPWSWTVSGYNDIDVGTDIKSVNNNKVDLALIGLDRENLNFDIFLNRLCTIPDEELIRKGKLYSRLWGMQNKNTDVFDFWLPWQQSSQTFYKYIYDTFIKSATMIGAVEDIRKDLLSMLELSGDITDDLRETILNSPKRNIGIDVDYRTYYNEETKELVRRSAMPIIEQFDYKF
jgi:hypothetical protein